ncbi:MAG TPA: tetratricopeptide repeat protein [Bacteroidales bacterium]|nr:tetratricopeptide repeat protein [Bacteroidales bacterium]
MAALKTISISVLMAIIMLNLEAQDNSRINEAFAKSFKAEQNGSYADGAYELKQVYREDSYPINVRLGWLLFLSKQYTESVRYYDRAISLKPYGIEARFGMIKACNALESWDKVKEQYEAILRIDSQNTTALYWLGVLLYNRKEYDQAAKNFEKIVNLYPMDYGSVIMLAWSKLYMGKKVDAKVLFDHALLLSPGDQSAISGLNQLK